MLEKVKEIVAEGLDVNAADLTEEISGVCRWSICWRKRRIWQTEG